MEDTMKSFIEEDDHEDYYSLRLSRLSRLSIETSDGCEADAEISDVEEEDKTTGNTTATTKYNSLFKDFFAEDGSTGPEYAASLPETPAERLRRKSEEWTKRYMSDTEAPRRRKTKGWIRRAREWKLDEAWEMKKKCSNNSIVNDNEYCRVLIKPSGDESKAAISMDTEEVRACRELGIDFPSDWTVEISSGAASPVAISSPGSDPREVKARLKVWAEAVALASASSLP